MKWVTDGEQNGINIAGLSDKSGLRGWDVTHHFRVFAGIHARPQHHLSVHQLGAWGQDCGKIYYQCCDKNVKIRL